MSQESKQGGGINISGGTISGGNIVGGNQTNIGGDQVSGDKITIGNVGAGAAVAAGRGAQASVSAVGGTDWQAWQVMMAGKIDAKADVSADDKQDAKEQVGKIVEEAKKGQQAEASRLERFINRLADYGPDIFEVTVATLENPLLGIGLVLKKINQRAKLERAAARA